ncbi:MAG: hypothetical protein M1824_002202 [Vezdaea acicularis]|nr:MAG: hypothetical protein M1824_002202 [Vezdaea acicularis]
MTSPGASAQDGPHAPASPASTKSVPAYYDKLPNRMRDVNNCDADIEEKKARETSFLLDYGREDAWILYQPTAAETLALLKSKKTDKLHTRWINIWTPYEHRDVVKTIAKFYDFSPRLCALMISKPSTPHYVINTAHVSRYQKAFQDFQQIYSPVNRTKDVEHSIPLDERAKALVEKRGGPDLSHWRIVDEVWHYSSVDWGKRYTCVGYNSLHHIGALGPALEAENQHLGVSTPAQPDKPSGKRVWSWLILCDDGTVISIYEDPFPGLDASTSVKQNILAIIRSNTMNVFHQITNPDDASKNPNPLMLLNLREPLPPSGNSASLLFHYLSDDWQTSYKLVAREEYAYGRRLDDLRVKMEDRPLIHDIKKLHSIGRQLSVLKKIYQSYLRIIDRVLDKQYPTSALAQRQSHSADSSSRITLEGSNLGVPLGDAVVVRFERLRDRISLYAIGELEDCLAEKESLVFMTFNLLTHKESSAIERLTRTTIFLAKVTILFLPVTLMTSYFSVQIPGFTTGYDLRTYWLAFLVVMLFSIASLFVFSWATGTLEGRAVYRTFWGTAWEALKVVSGRRARVGSSDDGDASDGNGAGRAKSWF